MNNSVEVYSDISVTTEVMSASPHRQIQMLYEKCLQHLETAKTHILNGDTVSKSKSISKANDIVHYLRTCLNFKDEEARDLSNLLDSIYIFMEKSLLKATLKNDVEYINQAHLVLSNVKAGWDGMGSEYK